MRTSVILLSLSFCLCALAQQTYQAQPTDDVQYYDQTFNPAFTTILRVWGDGQHAETPRERAPR